MLLLVWVVVLVYHYKQQNTVKRACNQSHGVLYPIFIGHKYYGSKKRKANCRANRTS
jgi:hypothetical protein